MEAKEIPAGFKVDYGGECMTKALPYIILKDHKDNFGNFYKNFINLCKSEMGKISKSILEKTNRDLLKILQVNLWRNSNSVIKCFSSIEKNPSVNLSI